MNSMQPLENICGAKTRSGRPCKKPPITGRTRCRLHGGMSPRGADHPSTRTGRWSRDIPTKLAARYAEAEQDPRLCELSADIAVFEARAAELLARVEQKDSDAFRQKAAESWEAVEAAARSGDAATLQAAMVHHGQIIRRGASDSQCWREALACLERKANLTMAEHKRQIDLKTMLPLAQAELLFASLVECVRRQVQDRATLIRIMHEFERIRGLSPGKLPHGEPIDVDAGVIPY